MVVKLVVAFALVVASATAQDKPHHKKPAPAADGKPKKPHHKGWPTPAAGPTESGDPELVFTFDDGPNPKTTPRVLDALAKHHIKAIFFMVGDRLENAKKVEPIVQRIVAEGHVIANHTMTHADLCKKKLSDEAAAAEIPAELRG
jgi:peptidoglycan/xylan/chitin deacetylase (PgdA/CDA1 family)